MRRVTFDQTSSKGNSPLNEASQDPLPHVPGGFSDCNTLPVYSILHPHFLLGVLPELEPSEYVIRADIGHHALNLYRVALPINWVHNTTIHATALRAFQHQDLYPGIHSIISHPSRAYCIYVLASGDAPVQSLFDNHRSITLCPSTAVGCIIKYLLSPGLPYGVRYGSWCTVQTIDIHGKTFLAIALVRQHDVDNRHCSLVVPACRHSATRPPNTTPICCALNSIPHNACQSPAIQRNTSTLQVLADTHILCNYGLRTIHADVSMIRPAPIPPNQELLSVYHAFLHRQEPALWALATINLNRFTPTRQHCKILYGRYAGCHARIVKRLPSFLILVRINRLDLKVETELPASYVSMPFQPGDEVVAYLPVGGQVVRGWVKEILGSGRYLVSEFTTGQVHQLEEERLDYLEA
ncbi:hypothetical protein NMY22_g9252 [Coprinellus aureogranulatus]|nr:hypothetical protein NMY22_g9252 [Coprinellus aureogranulatus]